MKKLLMLALIATLFSGCAKKIYVKPKLFAIDAKTKKLPTRKINFEVIEADDNVTAIVKSVLIPLRDARWITAKLNRCDALIQIAKTAHHRPQDKLTSELSTLFSLLSPQAKVEVFGEIKEIIKKRI